MAGSIKLSDLNGERGIEPQSQVLGIPFRVPFFMSDEEEPPMADEPTQPAAPQSQNQIQIQVDPHNANGVYSNLMMISHRKEEFILDFLFVQPQRTPQGQAIANLRSRVITTPEHMKRILKAMEENVARYEQTFGIIHEATDLPKVVH